MKQDILLKHRIGLRLSRAGLLAKLFAVQSFLKTDFEITPEQFTVLMSLKENNGMYSRQLADITYKDRPNMTRIVSILETNGFLTSELAADGRQVKKLYITEKGCKLCDRVLPEILRIWDSMVQGMSEDEVDTFISLLNKIELNLKNTTVIQN